MEYLSAKIANESLYQTVFDEGYVVWKPLNWSTYKRYRDASFRISPFDYLELENKIYEECVIYSSFDDPIPEYVPEEEHEAWIEESRNAQDAGIISSVVKSILRISGCTKPEQAMEQLSLHRETVGFLEDQLVIAICRAFPSYRPEEVEQMEWQTLLKRAAQAEAILGGQTIDVPFRIVDPEAERLDMMKKQKLNLDKEIADSHRVLSPQSDPRLMRQAEMTERREAIEAVRERKQKAAQLRADYFRQRGM